MSLIGGSSSSSTSTNLSVSSGADNGSTAITANGAVNILDGGAIEQAISLTKSNIETNQALSEEYLKGALGLASDSQSNAIKSSQYAMEQIVAAKAPDNVMVKNITYGLLVIAGVYVVSLAYAKMKGK